MVFIGGPRQVGKTTLAHSIGQQAFENFVYLNWDITEDRRAILQNQWNKESKLIIFDELHKYPKWKQWIKGVFDGKPAHQNYCVTGSARLNVYKKGGDSLVGRYHYWRLHPFSLNEKPAKISLNNCFDRLMSVGGFPEPFLDFDDREARRWRRERFDRILREDVRDLDNIQNLQTLSLFTDILRSRAGGLIKLSNIAQDLEIAPKTAKSWLELCEKLYLCFAIRPLTAHIARSIQKPPKVYFYDNADVSEEPGVRLENLVATHLLKKLQFLEDYEGYRCALHYIRDRDNREVDFVTVVQGKVIDLIEVKWSDEKISKSLIYYANMLKPERAVQIVATNKRSYHQGNILVVSPQEFFAEL